MFSRFYPHIRHLPDALALTWRAARGMTLIWLALLIVQGALPAALIYVSKKLVDVVVAAAAGRDGGMWTMSNAAFAWGFALLAIIFLSDSLQGLSEWISVAQAERVQDYVTRLVHEKSVSIDLGFYEMPEYYDRLHRARTDAATRPLALLAALGSLLQNGITFVVMFAVLVSYTFWLPCLLAATAIPAVYVAFRSHMQQHRWWRQSTTTRRWATYFDWLLTDSAPAAEIRLYGSGERFRSAYQTYRNTLVRGQNVLLRSQNVSRLTASAAAMGLSICGVCLMMFRAKAMHIGLGDLVLLMQGFYRGQNLSRVLLSSAGQVYSHSLFLGDLFNFLSLKPQITDSVNPQPVPHVIRNGIRFRNVGFRYPGSERFVLRHFNLEIGASKVVAIVGLNGAGKSTVLKLMCRFYDPEEGAVELDGVDIRKFKVAELREALSVVMQIPLSYQATVADNISIGNLSVVPEQAEIEDVAKAAGAHEFIQSLPRQYQTPLGKWFPDGTELSPGEKQRVALARAFLRRAPLLILDEPTSFMDPWSEEDWYDRFHSLAAGRTAMLITHRLNIAMRADLIHVMDEGRIVESGTHDELVAAGGLYAHSWSSHVAARATTHFAGALP